MNFQIDELHHAMLDKIALNLVMHFVAADMSMKFKASEIVENDVSIIEAITMLADFSEYTLSKFETGELSINDIITEESLNSIIANVKSNLIEQCHSAKSIDRLFKSYEKYLSRKYPDRV